MSGDHGHRHGPSLARSGARHWSRLLVSFALIATFFVVEAVGGVLTNSLALLSDAGHMLTDVIGLGLALTAIRLATRHKARRPDAAGRRHTFAAGRRHTFGLYRLEILAAFVNALLLFGVVDVHDLHVWTLTSGMDAASAHLMTTTDADAHQVLDRARTLLQERFAIDHATFKVEPETHAGCTEVAW